jgi:hypothetical protein
MKQTVSMVHFVAAALAAISACAIFSACATDPVGSGMEYCLDNAQTAIDASRGLEGNLAPAGHLAIVSKWKGGDDAGGIGATLLEEKTGRGTKKQWLRLESDRMPGLKLYAPVSGTASSDRFDTARFDADFSSAVFFCSHDDGWAWFDMPVSGRVTVEKTNKGLLLKSESGIERLPAHKARLRAGSKVMSGERALDALRNRQERIAALSDFMHGKKETAENPSWSEFKSFWQAYLFPETVSEKNRGEEWKKLPAKTKFSRAEEYSWSKEYTDAEFPENMRELRQTGALWRDWLEAGPWIYAEYNWAAFNRALGRGVSIEGIKK